MSLDIIGPANAPNAVTIRPTDSRSFGATDTWMKDCSSSTANDGTKVQAGWLNAIIGQCRNLIRGNGQTAGAVDIVTQLNSDDSMMLKAIQHLIQRGQPLYGDDTSGTANTVTVSMSPAPPEYKEGMCLCIKMQNAPTGPSVVNLNALGNKAIVRSGGVALTGGEWAGNDIVFMKYDGTNFQCQPTVAAGVRPTLSANTTLFVNGTTGNDSTLDGTQATVSGSHGPFKTIGRAIAATFVYGPSAFTMTIQIADGTYNENVTVPAIGGPAVVLNGNSGSPSNVLINVTAGNCVSGNGPNAVAVQNLKVATSDTNGAGIGANAGCSITTSNTVSGACAGFVFLANGGGTLGIGSHTFTANFGSAFCASRNGSINLGNGAVYTISTAITVSGAFVQMNALSGIEVPGAAPTFVNPGNVTGKRYAAILNGVINTQGQASTYFPGTVAGTTATGGQYA